MSNVLKMLSRGGAAAAETDPNFKQTVLLLHGDGTNGAQNNTFLDSSSNNFTITRNGNTTQGTFSPFSLAAGEWSNYFDGTNGFLTTASNAAFTFGTGDFTVEFWCYPISSTGPGGYAYLYAQGPNTTASLGVYFQSNTFRVWNGSAVITGTVSRTTNTWYHIAVSRSGTSMKLFVNGVQDGSTATNSSNITTGSTFGANIGRWAEISDANYFVGYLASVRVVKGTAVYTSNFTPSTTPLTAITNTSLLTCQSNRFVDNSTNAFAITRNGDVRVTPFSPFAPTAAYSAGTNGGSGYFDGSGDYLTVADNAALELSNNDWCLEFWIYHLGDAGIPVAKRSAGGPNYGPLVMVCDAAGAMSIYMSSNGSSFNVYSNQAAGSVVPRAWTHYALYRSGSNLYYAINGTVTSITSGFSATLVDQNTPWVFGGDTNADWVNCYFSDIRLSVGSAVYGGSNFSVPTAPLTAITNTALLLNFTNAGIIDNTGKNNLETVGNAQIDTAVKKYGTGSMKFDGTGDWLLMPNNSNLEMSSGNFTIEMWIYPSTTGSVLHIFGQAASQTASTQSIVMYKSATEKLVSYTVTGSTLFTCTSTGNLTQNQWNHIAFVRNGSTLTQYINGTADGTANVSTNSVNLQTTPFAVGQVGSFSTNGFNGYIDDLRITKGVARYTANFTPPTKEFPDL